MRLVGPQELGMNLYSCIPTLLPSWMDLIRGKQPMVLKLPGRFQAISGEVLPVLHLMGLIIEHLTLIL